MSNARPRDEVPLLIEESRPGNRGLRLPPVGHGFEAAAGVPPALARPELPRLPELSQPEVVRHYVRLSQRNYGLDNGMIPLGSCTMKHNPKVADHVAGWAESIRLHPHQHAAQLQGALRVFVETENWLKEVVGMDAVSLHGAAGAHGEYIGLLLARAYHNDRGEGATRTKVIVADSAHGTNPATAAMAGYDVVVVPSLEDGTVDLAALEAALGPDVAVFMLTNPNTLGIFENHILEIQKRVHKHGALLYYDGANLNAIMGKCRPGDMGFDICHINLHKTFATPHGGGGPGAGPVGVKARLVPYLPVPRPRKQGDVYTLDWDHPKSIGKVREFYGNFITVLRAYVYMLSMGGDGLTLASEQAVLNANYLKHRLVGPYSMPFKADRKHEFVLSASPLKRSKGVRALDVAKRLQDYGFYAPTVYFPHLVDEAIMVEPTESESKEELDAFADAMLAIAKEPAELVKSAPNRSPVARVDDVWAAKNLVLTWHHIDKVPTEPVEPESKVMDAVRG
jgi:glycine dehydrogenase subunit 2